jgi:hypothetical protein
MTTATSKDSVMSHHRQPKDSAALRVFSDMCEFSIPLFDDRSGAGALLQKRLLQWLAQPRSLSFSTQLVSDFDLA